MCGPTLNGKMHLGNFKTFYKSIKHFQKIKTRGQLLMVNVTDIGEAVYEKAETRTAGPQLYQYINKNVRLFVHLLKQLGLKPWTLDLRRTSAYVGAIKKVIKKLDLQWAASDRALLYDQTGIHPDKQSTLGYLWRSNDQYPVYNYGAIARPGIPGWHIECATLIALNFPPGEPMVHYGGADLKQIHHHNEKCILDSLGYKSIDWHYTQPIIIRGPPGQTDLKMSKSLKNGCFLQQHSNRVLHKFFIPYYQRLAWTKKNEFCADKFQMQLKKRMCEPLNLKKRCNRAVVRAIKTRSYLRSRGRFKDSDHIRIKFLTQYSLQDERKSTLVYPRT